MLNAAHCLKALKSSGTRLQGRSRKTLNINKTNQHSSKNCLNCSLQSAAQQNNKIPSAFSWPHLLPGTKLPHLNTTWVRLGCHSFTRLPSFPQVHCFLLPFLWQTCKSLALSVLSINLQCHFFKKHTHTQAANLWASEHSRPPCNLLFSSI